MGKILIWLLLSTTKNGIMAANQLQCPQPVSGVIKSINMNGTLADPSADPFWNGDCDHYLVTVDFVDLFSFCMLNGPYALGGRINFYKRMDELKCCDVWEKNGCLFYPKLCPDPLLAVADDKQKAGTEKFWPLWRTCLYFPVTGVSIVTIDPPSIPYSNKYYCRANLRNVLVPVPFRFPTQIGCCRLWEAVLKCF